MRATRTGLLLLAGGQLLTGVWALTAPAHFYGTYPGLGAAWVAADGPFNHHLVVDAGAGFAATGVALLLAAARPRRAAIAVALAAYLTQAIPHVAYHARHPAPGLPAVDQWLSSAPLAAGVLLAMVLLVAAIRRPRPPVPVVAAGPAQGDVPPLRGRPRDLLLLVAFAAARRRHGTQPPSWRVLARVPRVALARAVADAAHDRTRIVPAPVGALAVLRVATLLDCAFCVDILSAAVAAEGVGEDQVRDLARWRDSAAFDHDERLALALADALTGTPPQVPEGLVTALVARFGEAGVVELATTLGHENARARANRALGVTPQGFAGACPLPERVTS